VSGFFPGWVVLGHVINSVMSIAAVTVLFALIFRILPDCYVAWRDVWLGALFTAFLFTVGKFAIGFYLGQASVASAYGAAGSVVILLLWVYYSSLILYLGAEFTNVYAGHRERRGASRPLSASEGGTPERFRPPEQSPARS
jgi:membrane protein